MSYPANTPQAHAAGPPYQQSLAPRSSSLPFPYLMGLNQSKPTPPTPTPTTPTNAAAAATKGLSAAVAGGIRLKRAFAARRKKSEDPTALFAKSSQVADSLPPLSLPHNADSQLSPTPPTPPSKDKAITSRNSVIPLSPGISSAVNYIAMYDQSPSPSALSPEKEKDKETEKEKEKENIKSSSADKDKRETKESWRKSDSTNSHHTVRPHGSGSRASRPVSWAESFQSAHTVVQAGAGTSTRPLSALIGDADFGMPEERESDDDDEGQGVSHGDAENQDGDEADRSASAASSTSSSTSSSSHERKQGQVKSTPASVSASFHPPSAFSSTTTSSSRKAEHRRSMSLDLPAPVSTVPPPHAHTTTSAAAGAEMRHHRPPSHSISEGVPLPVSPPSSTHIHAQSHAHAHGHYPRSPAPAPGISSSASSPAPSATPLHSALNSASRAAHTQTPTSAVTMHNERIYPALPASNVSGSHPSQLSPQPRRPPAQNSNGQPLQPVRPQHQQQASYSSSASASSSEFSSTSSLSNPGVGVGAGAGVNVAQGQGVYPHAMAQQPSYHQQQPRTPTIPNPNYSNAPPSSYSNSNLSSSQQGNLNPNPQGSANPNPNQPRAQTTSISGLGPAAAGLAKRAVEKMGMGRKWAMGVGVSMGMGSGSSSSAGGAENRDRGGNASERDRGGGDGYSSSSSSAGPSSFSFSNSQSHSNSHSNSQGYADGYGLARTSSGSSAGHGHTSPKSHGHGHGMLGHNILGHRGAGSVSSVASGPAVSASAHTTANTSASAPLRINGGGGDGAYQAREGPVLGRKLRGALVRTSADERGRGRGVGLVFKRDLAGCVRDTGVWVGRSGASASGGDKTRKAAENENEKGRESGEKERMKSVRELEERRLPALVVRCAQHLLLWGVQEEGLFRVSGMPQHVARLRAEFDAGVDYDMTECTPGDLDPHAVASVFKAYLRELPEPILTQKLQPHFDAAVSKETTLNTSAAAAASAAALSAATPPSGKPSNPARMSVIPGRGLPSNPKSSLGLPMPMALRKPPSLSTLATPSFTGIPPPSAALVQSIRGLIALLPQENRDILRTVVELIRATAARSKETKMPLSNLMLVFCPSLGMTPPLMKVLCEAEGIWGEVEVKEVKKMEKMDQTQKGVQKEAQKELEEDDDDDDDIMDIRRRTVVPAAAATVAAVSAAADLPPPTPSKDNTTHDDAKSTADTESLVSCSGRTSLDTSDHNPSSDYHASVEDDGPSSSAASVLEGAQGQGQGQERKTLTTTPSVRNRRRRGVVSPVSARTSEVPTVYLDSHSCGSMSLSNSMSGSQSSVSSLCEEDEEGEGSEDEAEEEERGETTPGVNSFFHSQQTTQSQAQAQGRDDAQSVSSGGYSMSNSPPPPPLSSSAESVATRTSSGNPSFTHLASVVGGLGMGVMEKEKDRDDHGDTDGRSLMHPEIAETVPLERGLINSSNPGIAANATNSSTHAPASSNINANIKSSGVKPVQFPTSQAAYSPYHHFPPPPPSPTTSAPATTTTTKSKRRSIPVLSLPNFSPSIAPPLPNMSPAGSPRSAGFSGVAGGGGSGQQQQEKSLQRSKKPSLKLLFSKRSASSLTSLRDKGMAFISSPIPQGQGQPQVQAQHPAQAQAQAQPYSATSAMFGYRNSPRSASDSSVSTPLSAVTAPQSSLRSTSGNGSGTTLFPPVLDTPIEDGALGLDYGFEGGAAAKAEERERESATTTTATTQTQPQTQSEQQSEPPVMTAQRRPVRGRGTLRSTQNTSVSTAAAAAHQLYQLRPQASTSNLSVSSTASSHHLSLFEDDDNEDMEDWTQSVLLAADVDGNWAIQKPSASS